MTGFSEAKKILPLSFWRRLNFFPFGGLNPNLLFFIIIFIVGAEIPLFVWELANYCFVLFTLFVLCLYCGFFSGTPWARRIISW